MLSDYSILSRQLKIRRRSRQPPRTKLWHDMALQIWSHNQVMVINNKSCHKTSMLYRVKFVTQICHVEDAETSYICWMMLTSWRELCCQLHNVWRRIYCFLCCCSHHESWYVKMMILKSKLVAINDFWPTEPK